MKYFHKIICIFFLLIFSIQSDAEKIPTKKPLSTPVKILSGVVLVGLATTATVIAVRCGKAGHEKIGAEDTGAEDTGAEDTDAEDTDAEDTDAEVKPEKVQSTSTRPGSASRRAGSTSRRAGSTSRKAGSTSRKAGSTSRKAGSTSKKAGSSRATSGSKSYKNKVVVINTTMEGYLTDNKKTINRAVIVCGNAGRPGGNNGQRTHKTGRVGVVDRPGKGGQEESILLANVLGLAILEQKIEPFMEKKLSAPGRPPGTPAWGLKPPGHGVRPGDLYQGGNYADHTLKELAEGKIPAFVHFAESMPFACLDGSVAEVDEVFSCAPNFTCNRGKDSSTALTQVLDFRKNPDKANNLTLDDEKNALSTVRMSYKRVLRYIMKSGKHYEEIFFSEMGGNINSKIKQPRRPLIDSGLSKLISSKAEPDMNDFINNQEFKDYFKDTTFYLMRPDKKQLKRASDYTGPALQKRLEDLSKSKGGYWEDRYETYLNPKDL